MPIFFTKYIRRSISLACCALLALSNSLFAVDSPAPIEAPRTIYTSKADVPGTGMSFSSLQYVYISAIVAVCISGAAFGLYELWEESREDLLKLAGVQEQKVIEELGKEIIYQEE